MPHDNRRDPDARAPQATRPRRHWDTPKAALVCVGVYLVLMALLAGGPWWPMRATELPSRIALFGALATAVMVLVHRASLEYVTGRWGRIWGWAAAIVALFAAAMVGLRIAGDAIPEVVVLFIPRLAVLVVGLLALLGGMVRNADEDDDDEVPTGEEWFRQTSRILQARYLWSADQAREQVRLARFSFDRAQSRREPGAPELTPASVLGSPDDYAAGCTERPRVATDPLRSGRWYYLLTSIVLGAWALYRGFASGMDWLAAGLSLFAIVALCMFVWASWFVLRNR